MAEGFVRAMVAEAHTDIDVASVGIVGWEGSPAAPDMVQAAAERGVDISRHIARRLEPRHVEDAGAIVGMAGEHRDAVMRLVPEAAGKTFTLKELVRLLEALPTTPGPSFAERVTRADELRRSGFPGNPVDEDIADPLGASMEAFRAVAWDVEEWCRRLSPGLIPAASELEVS
jgi:protein-tyrosine phosphatase